MKFVATPGLNVAVTQPRLNEPRKIRFDENGFYETSNKWMIARLKRKFAVAADAPPAPEQDLKHCKKCNFSCANQGDLLAHYRQVHPKTKEH